MQKINYVLNDDSFFKKLGREPTNEDDEKIRIKTHLNYVIKLINDQNETVSKLSEEQKENRRRLIESLKSYISNGVFPVNSKYENQRSPCFRDINKNLCAVGYLMDFDGEKELVNEIVEKSNYLYVHEMSNPKIMKWATKNGFSAKELAMIQPTYRFRERKKIASPKFVRKVVHNNVECDNCGMLPIEGVRYKCMTCDDFDICEKCKAMGNIHTHHQFQKITVPVQYQQDNNNLNK